MKIIASFGKMMLNDLFVQNLGDTPLSLVRNQNV